MGGVYRRKRTHHGRLEFYRKCRLRNRTKDLDQIQEDLIPENQEKLLKAVLDEDLPGGGEFLCVECSRHFVDSDTLNAHKSTKLHKKRVKLLSEPAYTLEEANAAGGCGAAAFYSKKLEKIKPKFATHADKLRAKASEHPAGQSLFSYE